MKGGAKDKHGKGKDHGENLLVKGATLRVVSVLTEEETVDTTGELLAFTPMGYSGAEGLVLQPEKGPKRIVPLGSVLYVEVLKEAPEEKEPVEETSAPFYS